MRIYFKILFLFISSFILTSCFDIIEEINLKNDSSGNIKWTLNLSKSKTTISSLMLLDSINGHKILHKEDVNIILFNTKEQLSVKNGISNVETTANFNDFIFTISYTFDELTQVNTISDDFFKSINKTYFTNKYYFNPSLKKFEKFMLYNTNAREDYEKLSGKDKSVLKNAFHTTICRFESEVLKITNELTKISKSNKAIMMRASILDLLYERQSISNKVTLEN
jgi:hypothetical protein